MQKLQQGNYEHLEPVILTYQQTVDTLLAHGTDVSACDHQVSGWSQLLEVCYAGVCRVGSTHVCCMLIVV